MYIELINVNKTFISNKKRHRVLDNINLSIDKGEFICILGTSGCGKTTLLNLIAGFDKPDSGVIKINGKEVKDPNPNCIMTFQNFGLLPWRNVEKNVEFGLETKYRNKKKIKEIASQYIEMVGLSKFKKYHPAQLSSGMQQRVAFARTLAVEPEIILMDEPFGALDSITRMKMQDEILNISDKKKHTIIFVTHDIEESVYLSDRVFVMTPHSGNIKTIVKVDIPGERDRTSPDFQCIVNQLLKSLEIKGS